MNERLVRVASQGLRLAAASGLLLAATVAAAQQSSIAGIWIPDSSRSEPFPSDPPYTAEGRRIVAQWNDSHDPVADDPGRFCQNPGMPSLALSGAGYPTEIIVTPRQVSMLMEIHQQVRRVFLDQTQHPEHMFAQRNGYSIGHWEGDTLIVDTAGIRAITFGAVPHSDQVRVVERIRAIDDGATLAVAVTITDPVMYEKPVVVQRYYTAAPQDTRMLEYECTEGMWIEYEESRGREPF
jgi:hypothetical protein